MTNKPFFSKDSEKFKVELKELLYNRLDSVKYDRAFIITTASDWENGFEIARTQEISWLEGLLDKLEKS